MPYAVGRKPYRCRMHSCVCRMYNSGKLQFSSPISTLVALSTFSRASSPINIVKEVKMASTSSQLLTS